MNRKTVLTMVLTLAVAIVVPLTAAESVKTGAPDLKLAGPLAFGPDGVLFVGDPLSAAVFAIETGEAKGDPSSVKVDLDDVQGKIGSMLGVDAREVLINDLAVNPSSGSVYLSVSRGRGDGAKPVLLKVAGNKLSVVSLDNVKFSKATLPNPVKGQVTRRGNSRLMAITDLQYVAGRLLVAGLSNEDFASNLRSIAYPFSKVDGGTSVEIYHGAHGKFETRSPVRTFTTYNIGEKPHLLAAYTCTPLVKFDIGDLVPGTKVKGTTVAELGNGNRPLDMFVYKKGGKDFVLLANNRRGVMKITTDKIASIAGIESRVERGGKAGLTYETIEDLKGVEQLDRLNATHAVVLVRGEGGKASLKTVALP